MWTPLTLPIFWLFRLSLDYLRFFSKTKNSIMCILLHIPTYHWASISKGSVPKSRHFSCWSFLYMVLQKTVPAHKAHCVQEQAFFLPMLDIITFKICISLILSEHKCHFSTSGHLHFFCELPVLVLWPFICWQIKLYPVVWRDSAYFRLLCMLPLMTGTCPLSLVYSSCLGKLSPL